MPIPKVIQDVWWSCIDQGKIFRAHVLIEGVEYDLGVGWLEQKLR